MKKPGRRYRDAIFIITEERSCPIYNVGEELKIEQFCLSVPSFKPGCLYLAQEIAKIISSRDSLGGFSSINNQKSRFTCGGCEGIISFEFKKEKDFSTVQMKLLNETEEKRRRQHLDKFFGVLRNLDIFEPLDDDALSNLTLMLELRTIPLGKVVIREGEPGSSLFIVLQGSVAVIGNDGSRIAELGQGKIFGEMSLLSGEPASNSVHTLAVTQVASLSAKNFRHVLKKYPVLQLFLFKLLVDRAQAKTLRSGNISSGMNGELAEISVVDLFQLINSAQKTGSVDLSLDHGKAAVFFKEGEIVHARYQTFLEKEALLILLAEKKGHFCYTRGIPNEYADRPPIGNFIGMIMEGLQKIDEQRHSF